MKHILFKNLVGLVVVISLFFDATTPKRPYQIVVLSKLWCLRLCKKNNLNEMANLLDILSHDKFDGTRDKKIHFVEIPNSLHVLKNLANLIFDVVINKLQGSAEI